MTGGTTLDPALVAEWQGWIGRSESVTETIDPGALRRFAAAIGEDLDVERHWPSLGHWACFLPVVARDQVGEDGHPRRGGFLPPVTLPGACSPPPRCGSTRPCE